MTEALICWAISLASELIVFHSWSSILICSCHPKAECHVRTVPHRGVGREHASAVQWERKIFATCRILSSTICFPFSSATLLGQEYKCSLIHRQLLIVCLKGQTLGRNMVGKLEVWGRGMIHLLEGAQNLKVFIFHINNLRKNDTLQRKDSTTNLAQWQTLWISVSYSLQIMKYLLIETKQWMYIASE